MKKGAKIFSVVMAVSMLAATLSGCQKEDNTEKANYLTYWVELSSAASASVSNYGDTPFAKELQKRMGLRLIINILRRDRRMKNLIL